MNTSQNSYGRKFSTNNKYVFLFAFLAFLLIALFFASCTLGSTGASTKNAISSLFNGNFKHTDFIIIFYIRLPRTLAAILAGFALAVSGVIIQAVLSNPMAAPNVIGVNSGAGFMSALVIAFFPGAIWILPFAAFAGALCACLFIYALSVKTSASKLTITLVGIAVGSILNAGINTIKVLFPDSVYDTDVFMIGGFSGVTYNKLIFASIIILVSLVAAFLLARDIDILCIGENTAKSLGQNVMLLRLILLIIASALAGAAVSFAGLLGFVGLLGPHIMRKFVGNRHRLLIPAGAMFGGCLVLLCDIFARTAFAPYEIPVGIVLSIIGGVFFVSLVLTSRKGGGL